MVPRGSEHTRNGLVEHLAEKSTVCRINLILRSPPADLEVSRIWDQQAADVFVNGVIPRLPAFRYPGPTLPIIGVEPRSRHPSGGSRRYLAIQGYDRAVFASCCLHFFFSRTVICRRHPYGS